MISYDTPVYLKTYVHRVGRTARAGRAGQAFTLLRPQEVRHFKGMLTKLDAAPVLPHTVDAQELAAVAPACARALACAAAALQKRPDVRAAAAPASAAA